MATSDRILRINELAKKKKTIGLNSEELREQKKLREEYLMNFRRNFRAQLENIQFVDNIPEEEYSEKEKEHVKNLTEKLQKEFEMSQYNK